MYGKIHQKWTRFGPPPQPWAEQAATYHLNPYAWELVIRIQVLENKQRLPLTATEGGEFSVGVTGNSSIGSTEAKFGLKEGNLQLGATAKAGSVGFGLYVDVMGMDVKASFSINVGAVGASVSLGSTTGVSANAVIGVDITVSVTKKD